MKHFITALFAVLLSLPALAQNTFSIRGRVLDKVTGETLPGATVQVSGNGQNTGAGADTEGGYKIGNLPAGTYTVQASFIGYKPNTQTVKISTQSVVVTFSLSSDNASLEEVQVVASQAQERQTPVAFSAVNEVKLRETLSNRDLPMILNETPGVYATQGGGGTGDSRINVRGFDQRNVAVLVNGVPVNDMETGQVFWSNWDLGDVTKSLQVQRGLSASKISVPSVGGSINVLTRGFDDKKSVLARVEGGSNNYQKYSLMLSSGQLKGDWAVTVYGSRRTSDGWVDKAFDDAWTYFGNVSKRIGKHNLSLTGMGSPQRHGQRAFPVAVSTISYEKARELGVPDILLDRTGDRGFKYNPYWGTLDRYTLNNGVKTSNGQEVLNERTNFYHKPQINLNDLWQVNDRFFISTVLYASYGNGGGSTGLTSGNSSTLAQRNGQTDFQGIYNANIRNYPTQRNATTGRIDTLYGQPRAATAMLVNAVNSHRWYGFVLGGDYLLTDKLTLSAGLDGRTYTGLHYREVRDLLGADYAAPINNANAPAGTRLGVGDKISYNYDGNTRWLGGYSQLEYKTPLVSAVVSATLSQVSYRRIDYFQKTQADGSPVQTDWARFKGYSVKAGVNYNVTEHDNLFANVGYNSRVPFFNQVYTTQGIAYPNVRPEGITSFEVGYGINYPSLKATLNAYYTLWNNKSTNSYNSTDRIYTTVRNVNARHAGIELSVAQEISRRLQLNAAIALGDWRWTGQGLANYTDEAGFLIPGRPVDQPVYLNNVHVGDAAQNQFQMGLRYEPFRGAYIRPSFLLFTKYYSSFNPETILDPTTSTDSYRLPTSRNLDIHFGYDFKPVLKERVRLGFKGSVLNVLNEFYFTDVSNRSSSNTSSLNLLQAFFNRGRTFTLGLSATL
ncbi:TonB-dependent receptor [Hymenobacter properus]|uniref:TonB-dependent receptor n=1 Tax=Hymenobacter properus TaxID=2791026 RepID=A0A931BPN7_9BACT|nr:TonB-dependent receptor [Hymenobacter properus]MBF9143320.1 TonB-dependent receptor [Hymenobacter properus]MBR7722130.1 TonB-dependent receptor [Microvirga sp. SRT04]